MEQFNSKSLKLLLIYDVFIEEELRLIFSNLKVNKDTFWDQAIFSSEIKPRLLI